MAITYTRANATWANDEAGGTEIDATALNTIEAGVDAVYKLPNAAGELIYGSAADTLERLGAGTSTQVLHGGTTPSWSGIVSADITDGTIVNGDINASASIAYSKLNLATSIVNADISASAAIDFSKLASVAWGAYTPAWTSDGTQPAIGNGTLAGQFIQIGKIVIGYMLFQFGSSSTAGTGNYRFSIPVAAVTTNSPLIGMGTIIDDSGNLTTVTNARTETSTTFRMQYHGGNQFAQTLPIATLATNDNARIHFMYQAA